jgi:hypothetical protein
MQEVLRADARAARLADHAVVVVDDVDELGV